MQENNSQNLNRSTPTADQYLITALNMADWISADYKKLADTYKSEPFVVRQIYLCASDKVPIDILKAAEKIEPIEDSFKKVRRNYLEQTYLGSYSYKLEEIKAIAKSLGNEVKNMSGTVKHIAENIPSLEELFPSEPYSENGNEADVLDMAIENEDKKNVRYIRMQVHEEKPVSASQNYVNEEPYFLRRWKDNVRNILDRRKNPTEFINELYEKKYNDEQISYIISCIEEGLSEKDIEEFISPKFDVEMMKRLRKLYGKGES